MELDSGFRIVLQALEAGLEQGNENSEEKSRYSGTDDDEAALRKGPSIGNNGGIDDLNESALLRLVELGDLVLPRKDIKDRFVVFYVAQLADVLHAGLGNTAFGDDEFATGAIPPPPSFPN